MDLPIDLPYPDEGFAQSLNEAVERRGYKWLGASYPQWTFYVLKSLGDKGWAIPRRIFPEIKAYLIKSRKISKEYLRLLDRLLDTYEGLVITLVNSPPSTPVHELIHVRDMSVNEAIWHLDNTTNRAYEVLTDVRTACVVHVHSSGYIERREDLRHLTGAVRKHHKPKQNLARTMESLRRDIRDDETLRTIFRRCVLDGENLRSLYVALDYVIDCESKNTPLDEELIIPANFA